VGAFEDPKILHRGAGIFDLASPHHRAQIFEHPEDAKIPKASLTGPGGAMQAERFTTKAQGHKRRNKSLVMASGLFLCVFVPLW
jgi:hypothetical protein